MVSATRRPATWRTFRAARARRAAACRVRPFLRTMCPARLYPRLPPRSASLPFGRHSLTYAPTIPSLAGTTEFSRAMARQFIYHMSGLTKAYGPKKVLENIHLSFYPDAKIGILGPNGAGKSTILKIMAGLDKEYTGEAWLAEGATCGYLPQEPELDPALNVLGNVMEGVAAKKAIVDRYNELMMNYSDETAEEAARLQDEMD